MTERRPYQNPTEHEQRQSPSIAFERLVPNTIIDPQILVRQYKGIDYQYILDKLGPVRLYKSSFDEQYRGPFEIAEKVVKKVGKKPDVILYCTSHLPKKDAFTGFNSQLRAHFVRDFLAEKGMADDLETETVANTHTFSAACSSGVLALDFLRRTNPQGKNVLLVIDETGYRATMPPPGIDNGKAGLLFSDFGIAMQFEYGENGLEVLASRFDHTPQHADLLKMKVPELTYDPCLTAYLPPSSHFFQMQGPELLRFFRGEITRGKLDKLCQDANVDPKALDFFVSHQASNRMVNYFNKMFAEVPYKGNGIIKYGNTSSASDFIDLQDGITQGFIKKDSTGLVLAYGGGLAWGAAVVKLH